MSASKAACVAAFSANVTIIHIIRHMQKIQFNGGYSRKDGSYWVSFSDSITSCRFLVSRFQDYVWAGETFVFICFKRKSHAFFFMRTVFGLDCDSYEVRFRAVRSGRTYEVVDA